MRVHDSQAYRKLSVTRELIGRILELRETLLSFQTGFNLVNAFEGDTNRNENGINQLPEALSRVMYSTFVILPLCFTQTYLIDGDLVGKVDEQRSLIVDVLDHQRHLQSDLRNRTQKLSMNLCTFAEESISASQIHVGLALSLRFYL